MKLIPRGVIGLSSLLTRPRLLLWGTSLLFSSWFIYAHTMMVPGYIDRAGRFKGADYIQFYVMGSLVLEGRADDLYDLEAHQTYGRERVHPKAHYAAHPNYPPQIGLTFAPLALLPFAWSLPLFLLLTTLFYAIGVWMVWRDCPALISHGWLVALLAAASPLFLSAIRYAQLSAVTFLMWSAALAALQRKRHFTAGLVVGLLAYKPQLGLTLM